MVSIAIPLNKILFSSFTFFWETWPHNRTGQCCGTVPSCLGSGSKPFEGSGSYPKILTYFCNNSSCHRPCFLFLFSPASCMGQPVSRQTLYTRYRVLIPCYYESTVKMKRLLWRGPEMEPEPELNASIRFRFLLGQNDTVPVPEYWWRYGKFFPSNQRAIFDNYWLGRTCFQAGIYRPKVTVNAM